MDEHFMVFSDRVLGKIGKLQANIRSVTVRTKAVVPFEYPGEAFFLAYKVIEKIWKGRESQRSVSTGFDLSRNAIQELEKSFQKMGAAGLIEPLPTLTVDKRLEALVLLVKKARPHASNRSIVTLSEGLRLPTLTLEMVSSIQRSHGYGQRLDDNDIKYFYLFQRFEVSLQKMRLGKVGDFHDRSDRPGTFLNYDRDSFQHRAELFRELSGIERKRKVRSTLKSFGIHSSRFYALRDRYLQYGVRGLIDITSRSKQPGEKISPDLELKIIEERLMNPSLSTRKVIKELKLNCSQSRVQHIYDRWNLSAIDVAVPIRGVLSSGDQVIEGVAHSKAQSARVCSPELVHKTNLRVTRSFSELVNMLSYRSLPVCNPGAIIMAPLLEQLGIVEAIHTYGPKSLRTTEITNDIIVNTMRIIAGFPTVNTYLENSDRSVAIGSGILNKPVKSKFYRTMDDFSFHHLQELRNDLGVRATEIGIVEGKEIAIDYHCDPCDSRFPRDKGLTKAPDSSGDLVYAHRPHVIWDSLTNSIINIAYCEGRSRASASSLYQFLENNLFKMIDSSAIAEIYADSEYTGEKQLIYLQVRSQSSVTMCLKQNPKIKKWKEETINEGKWEAYGDDYRIASKDYILPETQKPFRFVVKQKLEDNETRCFGSTHVDWSPKKILDKYHIRWPVETGIKDLIENYFLNRPTGSSPEKVETHYYCVMIARTLVDYFRNVLCEKKWKKSETSKSVLSTIRTTLFSSQNCELSLTDSGDLQLTYLDGDPLGIKSNVKQLLERRKKAGLNTVSWWGGRGLHIEIEDRYHFDTGSQNVP
jgi:hypothetical protein